jgi:hypothetical protein
MLWINFNALPITNMWQVYTRPTSASDFFFLARLFKHNVIRFTDGWSCFYLLRFPPLDRSESNTCPKWNDEKQHFSRSTRDMRIVYHVFFSHEHAWKNCGGSHGYGPVAEYPTVVLEN